ncbi:MAG TPA: hypothetical protein VGD69_09935 [Herpetosiphonaceae bacterium]
MPSSVRDLLAREDFFDAAILWHGFTDYMRDYEIIVGARNGPPYTDVHRYQFIGCVAAMCTTALPPASFVQSLPDQLVYAGPDYPDQDVPDGFVWGVRYSTAYPGLTYVEQGEYARTWSQTLNYPMHEITLETEAFHLRLVFADVRYVFVGHDAAAWVRKMYPISLPDTTTEGAEG